MPRIPVPLPAALLPLGVSVLAGVINGLLGSGGGTVLYFYLCTRRNLTKKQRFAAILFAIGCACAVSVLFYSRQGNLPLSEMGSYVLPALLGGMTGAWLYGHLNPLWLQRLFALLTLYAGWRMLW